MSVKMPEDHGMEWIDQRLEFTYYPNGIHCGSPECQFDLIEEWRERDISDHGPIRTRTVTEIVPGEYGPVSVRIYDRDPSDHVRLSLFAKDEMYRALDAAELRESARIFISLAEALEENAK